MNGHAADLLSEQEMERYARQIVMADIGAKGQRRLLAARVLIVGVGGLGSPAALYLGAAGVGTLGLVDFDRVSLSNLQRQILYRSRHVGAVKTEIAAAEIKDLNPAVQVITPAERFAANNGAELVRDYDFVLDCTDSFDAKQQIAQSCYAEGKPYCHAGIVQFQGQVLTVLPGETACLQCLLDCETLPPSRCSEFGVLGAAVGILGSIQATEALKYILGKGELLTNRLLLVDAFAMTFRTVPLRRCKTCIVCGG